MPDQNSGPLGLLDITAPIATLTASYQINGGSSIAAGASITDTVTFTGLATSDKRVGVTARDALLALIPKGLQLTGTVISAADTLKITWKNTTLDAITPPASATWTCIVYGTFGK